MGRLLKEKSGRKGLGNAYTLIGRNNWLFADTPRGAEASSILYSIIVSAKLNELDPYSYLRALFTELPTLTDGDLTPYLPWNWKPSEA